MVNRLHIDVDAYLHPIVHAYRFEDAIDLFAGCRVDWTAVSGLNAAASSKLSDLMEVDRPDFKFFTVQSSDLFERQSLGLRYRRLDKRAKLRVIELRLRPTGFTILAGRGAPAKLAPRIEGNVVS